MIRNWAVRGDLIPRFKWILPPGILAAIAALPWGYGYSYSRGYDLFLWIYNAWYLKLNLLAFQFPNWSPYAAAGQPFFKVAGLADSVLLSVLMWFGGTFVALQIFVVVLYLVAALGTFYLSRTLTRDSTAAAFASGAYVLSWFITFTVYFQAYLSNFLIYASLPWFVLLYDQAVKERCLKKALGASLVLALCITTNPQVALKVAFIGGGWVLLKTPSGYWRSMLEVSGVIALGALWVTAFNVISALQVREEALSVSYRLNGYTGPLTFVIVPLYGLNLLSGMVAGFKFLRVPLWEVLYSEGPGISIALMATLSLVGGGRKIREVQSLWGLILVGYGLFFLAVPYLPASEWVGTTHNLIIIPTFALSLLCGYGIAGLRTLIGPMIGEIRANWALSLLGMIALLELGGLKLGLVHFATTRTPPQELPEVGVWRQVAAQLQPLPSMPRFYSYNPDHTIYLFPVLTGCATANVIELRQRLPEYESFLRFLRSSASAHQDGLRPSRHLALLNVEYVDLPYKLYEYQGPNAGKGDYTEYTEGIGVFDQDANLERFCARNRERDDIGHDVTSTAMLAMLTRDQQVEGVKDTVQIVYHNRHRLPAFVAPHAVAIVGGTRSGEQVFEEIAGRPDFQPERVLYLLVESIDEVDEAHRRALRGYIPVDEAAIESKVPRLSMTELSELYKGDALPAVKVAAFEYRGNEQVDVELEGPVGQGAYLFVSQQRFESWKAYDQAGERLSVFKAEAGLSAVFLKPGTRSVVLRYALSQMEVLGRWFSGLGLLGIIAILLIKRGPTG